MQGQPTDFNVWTREAGHGSLAISVEGPSKAIVDFKVGSSIPPFSSQFFLTTQQFAALIVNFYKSMF